MNNLFSGVDYRKMPALSAILGSCGFLRNKMVFICEDVRLFNYCKSDASDGRIGIQTLENECDSVY